jgi:AraC family transcriptional regulator, ethanolamine operon transcriptional activator
MAQLLKYLSHDADEQAQALDYLAQSYEQLGCGKFAGSLWHMMMEEGVLMREAANRPLEQRIVIPKDHVAIAISVRPDGGFVLDGRTLAAESLMVMSDDNQYRLISSGESELVGMSTSRSFLVNTLDPIELEWFESAESLRNLELRSDVACDIRNTLMMACTAAERDLGASSTHRQESELLSATITKAVSLAMRGRVEGSADVIPRRAESRMKVVNRAVDYMRANMLNDIGIPDICSAACASRRTLQYCFEELMHTAPQAHLRALRLNEARRRLKREKDTRITEIASLMGFSSASHFTRYYKQMFDELPSDTVRIRNRARSMS